MSNKSCAVPTPEQRMFLEFRETTEKAMIDAIYSAIDHAAAEMADKVRTAGLDIPATDRDYFTFAPSRSSSSVCAVATRIALKEAIPKSDNGSCATTNTS